MLNIALVCKYVAHMGHWPSGLSKINLHTIWVAKVIVVVYTVLCVCFFFGWDASLQKSLFFPCFMFYNVCFCIDTFSHSCLFCMFVLYDCFVCLFCMCVLYVCFVCLFCMFVLYVRFVCLICMCVLYVCFVCLFCMFVLYVCFVCYCKVCLC